MVERIASRSCVLDGGQNCGGEASGGEEIKWKITIKMQKHYIHKT